jgi:uncharacterized protein
VIALDTNVLVHAHRRDAALHAPASRFVRDLAESPAGWAICHHSLVEFCGVVTNPRVWRAPSSPEQALEQIRAWRESPSLRILPDSEETLDLFDRLVRRGQVRGAMVHDARIAACCLAHGIDALVTLDRDFSRFPDLRTRPLPV